MNRKIHIGLSLTWHRLPKEVMESLSLQMIKSCLDMVLGNWLWVALYEQGYWIR